MTNAAQKLELEKDFGLYDADWYLDDISLKKKYFQKYKSVVAGVDTDWLAKPLRNAVGTKHSLAIELGGKNLQVMANFSYNNIAYSRSYTFFRPPIHTHNPICRLRTALGLESSSLQHY